MAIKPTFLANEGWQNISLHYLVSIKISGLPYNVFSIKCIGVLLLYIANIKLDQFVTLRFTSPMPSYYTCLTVLPFQVLVPTSRFSDITCITCWKSNPSIRGRGGHCLLSATERDIKAFSLFANMQMHNYRAHTVPPVSGNLHCISPKGLWKMVYRKLLASEDGNDVIVVMRVK